MMCSSSSPEPAKPLPFSEPLSSARTLSWLLVKGPTHLKVNEQQTLAFIQQDPSVETISVLTQPFLLLLKERQAEQVEAWLKMGAACGIPEIEAFSQGVWRDRDAVKAAFQLPSSNGPTEGFINRLKLLKRSMYGRGSFELLRQRILNKIS